MTSRTWILGAPDPEMEMIERLLRQAGERVLHAVGREGRRVTAAAAYAPHAVSGDVGEDDHAILVECDLPAERVVSVKRCDHHRPGDPGYGRPPAEYLAASSIGQVLHLLLGGEGRDAAIAADPELRLVAAADHCLGAAYRGECPGVDPDQLMRWRAASRATFQRRTVEAVLADVEAAMAALRAAPELLVIAYPPGESSGQCGLCERPTHHDYAVESDCDGICEGHIMAILADMRRPTPVPELPEAATRLGVGYVSGPLKTPGQADKFTCSGTPAQVRAWMDIWAPPRLTGIYGDPERGFAGGYAEVMP